MPSFDVIYHLQRVAVQQVLTDKLFVCMCINKIAVSNDNLMNYNMDINPTVQEI